MKNYWEDLQKKFQARQPREKAIIFGAGLVIVGWGGFLQYIEPPYKEMTHLQQQHQRTVQTLNSTNLQMSEIQSLLGKDPNMHEREKMEKIAKEMAQLDQRLKEHVADFVPPEKMTELLQDMLLQAKQLKLEELGSIEPEPLEFTSVKQAEGAEKKVQLFQHGIVVTFRGTYFDVYHYLRKLETLPWRFFWRRMHYEVTRYPLARVQLELVTISADEKFFAI